MEAITVGSAMTNLISIGDPNDGFTVTQNSGSSSYIWKSYTIGTVGIGAISNGLITTLGLLSNNFLERKEELFITALNNLLKRAEFLQLSAQLSSNELTEEEFDNEIESNPGKYVVNINYLENERDIEIISSIVQKLDRPISMDDVAEIFSIEYNSLNDAISKIFLNR